MKFYEQTKKERERLSKLTQDGLDRINRLPRLEQIEKEITGIRFSLKCTSQEMSVTEDFLEQCKQVAEEQIKALEKEKETILRRSPIDR